MRWISLIVMLLCLGQIETVQVFVGDDGCYGDGTRWVVRNAIDECEHGDGGWGSAVLECYTDDVAVCNCGMTAVFYCSDIVRSPDLDGDGDVDLEDFAEMTEQWTGPE